jgi:hypothetical protein
MVALRAELSLFSKGTDMILKDNVSKGTSCIEPISSASLFLLAPDERRAPIVSLSLAKRKALIACLNADGLRKKDGAWHGPLNGKPVSGATVADLSRDGMLALSVDHHAGSARLTKLGSWFARTLVCETVTAEVRSPTI